MSLRKPMSASLDGHTDLLMNSSAGEDAPLLIQELPVAAQSKTGAVSTFFIFLKSYLGSGIMGEGPERGTSPFLTRVPEAWRPRI
jgi:hypothetical protein